MKRLIFCCYCVCSYTLDSSIGLEKNLATIADDLAMVKNVSVYLQFPYDNQCGHHALKNGLYYMSYLDGNIDALSIILDKNVYDDFFEALCEFMYGSLDENIYDFDKWSRRYQPLDNGTLLRILQEYKNKLPQKFNIINRYFAAEYITVLSDYPQWYLMSKDDVVQFLAVVELLQKSENYKHVFLLGVDSRFSSNTHWIAVVAYKKNGHFSYRLLDSLGYDRRNATNVKSLIRLLSQEKSEICKVITQNISNYYQNHFNSFVHIFQNTGAGAKGIYDELHRFIELYQVLQNTESLFPTWMNVIQKKYLQLCNDFLDYTSDKFTKLSDSVKTTVQNNKSDIESLRDYLVSESFKKYLSK